VHGAAAVDRDVLIVALPPISMVTAALPLTPLPFVTVTIESLIVTPAAVISTGPRRSAQLMTWLAVLSTIGVVPLPRWASLPPGHLASWGPVFAELGQPQVARFSQSLIPPEWQ
jgi:hypothetical protein